MKNNIKDVAVVAGGTGAVGDGIVRHFLERGLRVVVPYRDRNKAQRLKLRHGRVGPGELHCLHAELSDSRSAQRFKERVLEKFGGVQLVVASLGGWYQGEALHEMPIQTYRNIMEGNLHVHFVFAKLFLSEFLRQNHGTYVNLNGSSIKKIKPGAGIISVAGTALETMSRVFALETAGTGVKIHSVALFTPVVSRDLPRGGNAHWISATQTGAYILKLHAGNGDMPGKMLHCLHSVDDLHLEPDLEEDYNFSLPTFFTGRHKVSI